MKELVHIKPLSALKKELKEEFDDDFCAINNYYNDVSKKQQFWNDQGSEKT